MWIPRPIYEAMPPAFVAAGALLILLAFKLESSPQMALMVAGGLLATIGLMLWMKRKDYRTTHKDYDPHSLDE